MAVDLFTKYYSNPDKQYLYSSMVCSGAGDGGNIFSISGDEATITNGANTLASTDLSAIKEILTEYTNETRTIEPYDFIYVKGFSKGRTYQRNVFVKIPDELWKDAEFLYITGIDFYIDYYKNGIARRLNITAAGSVKNEKSFIEVVQEIFEQNQINVDITAEDQTIVFRGNATGYEFHVGSCQHPNGIRIYSYIDVDDTSENYPHGIEEMMYDYCPAYVPPFKYKNGAFRGIVLKPTYPEYNADNIAEQQKALHLAFIPNRIHIDMPVKVGCARLYEQRYFDILGDYTDLIEKQQLEKIKCSKPNADTEKAYCEMLKGKNVMGIYGFVAWMYQYNYENWLKFGSIFMDVAPIDTLNTADKNLIPGFVVYNPNPFPVILNMLLFA